MLLSTLHYEMLCTSLHKLNKVYYFLLSAFLIHVYVLLQF